MVKRGGKVKSKSVSNVQTHTLLNALSKNIEFGSRLITDDYGIYKKSKRLGLFHDSINHSKGKYVKGDIHINTIEGFWSQMKRSIDGTYHSVSEKHLQSYVDQFVFYYNQRFFSVSAFEMLLSRLCQSPYVGGQRIPSFLGVGVS